LASALLARAHKLLFVADHMTAHLLSDAIRGVYDCHHNVGTAHGSQCALHTQLLSAILAASNLQPATPAVTLSSVAELAICA
jgi:hypothetical protein